MYLKMRDSGLTFRGFMSKNKDIWNVVALEIGFKCLNISDATIHFNYDLVQTSNYITVLL